MKRLLLDTHALLWWLSDDPRLNSAAREAIAAPQNVVWVSAATVWEIGIKQQRGKLMAPEDMDSVLDEEGFEKLLIDCNHAQAAPQLPFIHKDPFDRMLIAQAQMEGLTLVTSDANITQHPVRLLKCAS